MAPNDSMEGENMRKFLLTPGLPILGVALLLTSCSTEATPEEEETTGAPTIAPEATETSAQENAEEEGDQTGEPEGETTPEAQAEHVPYEHRGGVDAGTIDGEPDFLYVPPEQDQGPMMLHLQCEDEEALAEKEAHNNGQQPAGWPQDWDGEGAMPDPLCHPDYLEIQEWEHMESHMACWEGEETSMGFADETVSQAEGFEILWSQSQARADWPGYEGTCEEQFAQHEKAGGHDEE